jgi:hypothetical protein
LFINDNAEWTALIGDGVAGNPLQTLTTPVVPADMFKGWRHVVLTYDGTSQTLRLWVNAIGPDPTAELPGVNYAANAAAPLGIAAGGVTAPDFFFAGRLDEVAVYNVALDATAVVTHFGAAFLDPPPP